MKIKTLKTENFGALKNKIHFTHGQGGIEFFYGANESGKSTLQEAIITMLYGFEPAKANRHPYYNQCGSLLVEGELLIQQETHLCQRQLRSRPLGTLDINGEPTALGNKPHPECREWNRGFYKQLFTINALNYNQFSEGFWKEIFEKWFWLSSAEHQVSPTGFARYLEDKALKIWRKDNRGQSRSKAINDQIRDIKIALNESRQKATQQETIRKNIHRTASDILETIQLLKQQQQHIKILNAIRTEVEYHEKHRFYTHILLPSIDPKPSPWEDKTLYTQVKEQLVQDKIQLEHLEMLLRQKQSQSPLSNSKERIVAQKHLHTDLTAALEYANTLRQSLEKYRLQLELIDTEIDAIKTIPWHRHMDTITYDQLEVLWNIAENYDTATRKFDKTNFTGVTRAYYAVICVAIINILIIWQMDFTWPYKGWSILFSILLIIVGAYSLLNRSSQSVDLSTVSEALPAKAILKTITPHNIQEFKRYIDLNRKKIALFKLTEEIENKGIQHIAQHLSKENTYNSFEMAFIELKNTLTDTQRRIEEIETYIQLDREIELLKTQYASKAKQYNETAEAFERFTENILKISPDINEAFNKVEEHRRALIYLNELLKSAKEIHPHPKAKEFDTVAQLEVAATQAEDEIATLHNTLQQLKVAESEMNTELKHLMSFPSVEDHIGTLKAKETEKDQALHEYNQLQLAIQAIKYSETRYRLENQPKVLELTGEYYRRLTQCKYQNCFIEDGKMMLGFSSGNLVDIDTYALSTGSVGQLYFALRLALIQCSSHLKNKLPILLDEPFAFWDNERIHVGIDLLKKICIDHQVFIFSCREDLRTKVENDTIISVHYL